MNIESESEPGEPPGSPSVGSESSNAWSWTIEFNLDDLVGGSLTGESAGENADEIPEAVIQDYLTKTGLSLEIMRSAIAAVLNQHEVNSAEVSVAIVSGPTMRRLNQQYLQHDFDTDVLSFCLSDPQSPDLLAQLIVSVDYAQHQVEQLKNQTDQTIQVNDELCLYLVHGTLHTLGYDDHEDEDRLEMRQAERELLATVGITPYWPTEDLSQGVAND